ncbi:2'-5' RNA ligase family protein [Candidatus Nitrospira bockiana]
MPSYHLWLTPTGPVADLLARTILELARRYQGPAFAPHVTLLGHVTDEEAGIVAGSTALAASRRPITMTLVEPGIGPDYFHCVFLTIQPTPDLLEVHEEARARLGTATWEPYRPHLSLLYGDHPREARAEIARSLALPLPMTCPAAAITVVKAEGDAPETWREIASVPIGRSPERPW